VDQQRGDFGVESIAHGQPVGAVPLCNVIDLTVFNAYEFSPGIKALALRGEAPKRPAEVGALALPCLTIPDGEVCNGDGVAIRKESLFETATDINAFPCDSHAADLIGRRFADATGDTPPVRSIPAGDSTDRSLTYSVKGAAYIGVLAGIRDGED